MQAVSKAQTDIQSANRELVEVEKLIYARDACAPAALQALDVRLQRMDREFSQLEKLVERTDPPDHPADKDCIKFTLKREYN